MKKEEFNKHPKVQECNKDENKYLIVRVAVAKSALKAIDEDDEDPQIVSLMDSILCRIILGEEDGVIAGKSFAELAGTGLFMPMDDIEAMCKKTREKCQKQLLGLQIAYDSLQEYNCSAEAALSQIAMLL